ncbi:MAG: dihydrolipoyl dehydrogenase [Paludibacteraceae bacterium]|nr:dihydrolipoyl dehydrogenase [Paludibacteraceae bacterium]
MKYFLGIIGGGPAGYTAAAMASKAGKDVVLFEQNALGGTCLNVGCIPTKTLLYSAKQYFNATHADKYGVTASDVTFDYAKMVQRKTKVVRKLVAGIKMKLNNEHCTVINAPASVASYSPELITLTAQRSCSDSGLTGEADLYEVSNLLICTGSHNFVPPIPGIADNPHIWDSTSALAATQLPESIAIVGGGVIGMEFATLYHELGVPVTVIEAMPTILPNLDQDIVKVLRDKYIKSGITILENTKVERIEGQEIYLSGTAGLTGTISANRILVSVGRRANIEGLEALTDLEYNRGAIVVDDFMKTNLDKVYAAGDVTGKIMLAHVASRQAEVAVGRMLKTIPVQRIAYNAIPSVVYTNPEIACVGLSEAQTAELYLGDTSKFTVKSIPMTFSGRFVAENEGEMGLVKMIIDNKSQSIIGVHMIGNPCSEFVAAASFAIRMGYTVPEFEQVVFPHPTVSEVLKEIL